MNKLPQKEENTRKSENRKKYLQRMQAEYEYMYEYANTIAIAKKLPWREIPGLGYWIRGGMNLLLLIPSLPSLLMTFLRHLFGRPLTSYRDYVFFPLSPQPNPELVDNFQHDLIFGLQRVIGVNPVVLRAVTQQQPLPEKLAEHEIRRIFSEQIDEIDYTAAIQQKRVYILDYAVLDVLQQNPGHIDGNRKQHITTPIVVLFQQPDGMLRPIAIQLYQEPAADNPIYTKKDGNLWLAAKTFAQIADGNHHILYTHATRIHYVMEAVIMASRRQLYKSHPVNVLLNPHLQHTLNVNHQHTFLKNRKGRPGRFGELFAGDYDATTQCMANGMTSFDFKASAFLAILPAARSIIPTFSIRTVMTVFYYGWQSKTLAKNMSISITNRIQILLKTMRSRHGQTILARKTAVEFLGSPSNSNPNKNSSKRLATSFFSVRLIILAFISTSTNIRDLFPICRIQPMSRHQMVRTPKWMRLNYLRFNRHFVLLILKPGLFS